LAVREPLNGRLRAWFGVLALLMPIAAWSVISYVPFVWHPLVLVSDAGTSDVPGR
jgi:NitT/TauT family transport system permease protein